MYREMTDCIQVDVEPTFVPERSSPEKGVFFFAYQVQIRNLGEQRVQLLDRKWQITDGRGRVHEVQGVGVVGEQPVILPGGHYEYTSFCPLPTPTGNMRGSYKMKRADGTTFVAAIPLFFLRDLRRVPARSQDTVLH